MTAAVQLRRGTRRRGAISLVPLVDVLLILLIFFMVTSRYENLGMIAIVTADEAAPAAAPQPTERPGRTVLLRLDADGRVVRSGSAVRLDGPALEAMLREVAGDRVRVLASPEARTQALVDLAEAASRAGVADLRLLRVGRGS